jgi:uncharacterized membrane protein
MTTSRLEAFSDGVIAVIITIMVLELHAPAAPTLEALLRVAPGLCSYVLSFLVVAIMWVNHHHMMHAAREVTARLLWFNINLLFWMSLIPFVTDYMGKNYREPLPVALYGLTLTCCAIAFYLLRTEFVCQTLPDPEMAAYHAAIRRKNIVSGALYFLAAPLAYVSVYASFFIFALIPAMYFLPEKRLQNASGAMEGEND